MLILRIVLGGTFVAHGSQKLFVAFGGPGLSGFADALAGYGYRAPGVLSVVTAVTEVVGGGLVVLGLFTPLAAAGLVGIMVNAVWLSIGNGFFVSPDNPGGAEVGVPLGGLLRAWPSPGPDGSRWTGAACGTATWWPAEGSACWSAWARVSSATFCSAPEPVTPARRPPSGRRSGRH